MPAVVAPTLAASTNSRAEAPKRGPPRRVIHCAGSETFSARMPASPTRLRTGTGRPIPSMAGRTAVRTFGASRHGAGVGPPGQEADHADLDTVLVVEPLARGEQRRRV